MIAAGTGRVTAALSPLGALRPGDMGPTRARASIGTRYANSARNRTPDVSPFFATDPDTAPDTAPDTHPDTGVATGVDTRVDTGSAAGLLAAAVTAALAPAGTGRYALSVTPTPMHVLATVTPPAGSDPVRLAEVVRELLALRGLGSWRAHVRLRPPEILLIRRVGGGP